MQNRTKGGKFGSGFNGHSVSSGGYKTKGQRRYEGYQRAQDKKKSARRKKIAGVAAGGAAIALAGGIAYANRDAISSRAGGPNGIVATMRGGATRGIQKRLPGGPAVNAASHAVPGQDHKPANQRIIGAAGAVGVARSIQQVNKDLQKTRQEAASVQRYLRTNPQLGRGPTVADKGHAPREIGSTPGVSQQLAMLRRDPPLDAIVTRDGLRAPAGINESAPSRNFHGDKQIALPASKPTYAVNHKPSNEISKSRKAQQEGLRKFEAQLARTRATTDENYRAKRTKRKMADATEPGYREEFAGGPQGWFTPNGYTSHDVDNSDPSFFGGEWGSEDFKRNFDRSGRRKSNAVKKPWVSEESMSVGPNVIADAKRVAEQEATRKKRKVSLDTWSTQMDDAERAQKGIASRSAKGPIVNRHGVPVGNRDSGVNNPAPEWKDTPIDKQLERAEKGKAFQGYMDRQANFKAAVQHVRDRKDIERENFVHTGSLDAQAEYDLKHSEVLWQMNDKRAQSMTNDSSRKRHDSIILSHGISEELSAADEKWIQGYEAYVASGKTPLRKNRQKYKRMMGEGSPSIDDLSIDQRVSRAAAYAYGINDYDDNMEFNASYDNNPTYEGVVFHESNRKGKKKYGKTR